MMSRSDAPADGCGRSAAALALLSAVLVPLHTRAQSGESIELEWHALPGCPRAEQVIERIEALAGPATKLGTPLRAEATISRSAGRLRLKLVVRWGSLVGERNIDGVSCDDLAGAAAVNIALLLRTAEPNGPATPIEGASPRSSAETTAPAPSGTRRGPEASAAPHDATAATSATSVPRAALHEDDRSPARLRGFLQVPLASVAFGPVPGPSFGASLGGGVSLEAWRFGADATFRLRRRLTLEDRPAVGAHIDRVDARVRACRAFGFADFELAPCAQLSLSHVWARGSGAHVRARTAESTWIGAGAGVQARLPLAPWVDIFAAIDVRIESARPRISVEGAGVVGQLGLVTVDLSAGVEWIL